MGEKLTANKNLVYREEDDEALLFNPDDGSIKLLNKTGNLIWKLCDGTRDKEQIINELTENFPDVAKTALENDLENFLNSAHKKSLIFQQGTI